MKYSISNINLNLENLVKEYIEGNLTFIKIYNAEKIRGKSFQYLSNLEFVDISDSVKYIGFGAFYKCNKISKLVIPFVGDGGSQNTHLGYIFGDKDAEGQADIIPRSLKEVVIKNSNGITIGEAAFYECEYIEKISFVYPKGNSKLTEIGRFAFSRCYKLKEITIPSSVKKINEYAFQLCTSLNTINFGGTRSAWRSITKGNYWNVDIPATKVICSDGEVSL